MARITRAPSIESRIASYVSNLSASRKQAVLTVAKTFAEEEEAEFEREWAKGGYTVEEARQHTLNTVRKFFNEKRNHKR